MSALYPNVPIALGVPPVLRQALSAYQDAEALLTTSGEEVNADTTRQWGVFTQGGILAIEPDNIPGFENTLEARISDYPVEDGGFASYNKVQTPFEVRLMMTKGGSVEDRQQFLKECQDAWQIPDLFNVVTPECVYLDMNVIGVRRQAAADQGATLMRLELILRKVRQTATLTFTNTKEAPGSGQVNDGPVQAQQLPARAGTPA